MATLHRRLFNTANDNDARPSARKSLAREDVNRALNKRLQEKIRNYDREAAKLEFRGQEDAAQVLRKAAHQLKSIVRTSPHIARGAY